jgi:uncharacterized Tic20 family protein
MYVFSLIGIASLMNLNNIGQIGFLQSIGPLELLLFFVLLGVLAVSVVLVVMICVKPKPKRSTLSESPGGGLSQSHTQSKEFSSGEIGRDPIKQDVISSPDDRNWCMFIHLSQFCNYVVPIGGLIVPLILWVMKKDESAIIDLHGKIVLNWIITEFILAIGFGILIIFIIGIPLLLALLVLGFVFPILGAVKAQNGETWPYPFSFEFIKLDA